MSDIKIFVSHRIDLKAETVGCPLFYNVRCGAIFDTGFSEIPGDDTGDNISEKRLSYCELTILYWAYKNVEADYYGFSHYRRFLSFSDGRLPEDKYGNAVFDYLNHKTVAALGHDENQIRQVVEQYDCVLSTPWDVRSEKHADLYDQYNAIPHLYAEDLRRFAELIKQRQPDYAQDVDSCLGGHLFYPCNLFVMKKALFMQYCKWLYPILEEYEQNTDFSKYSEEGLRTIGHLAERALGIFYYHIKRIGNFKIHTLQRAIILHPQARTSLEPYYREEENPVPIVMAFSDYYMPYAAVTLDSLLACANAQYCYDIIVLHTDISPKSQEQLLSAVQRLPGAHLRFYDIGQDILEFDFIVNNHLSKETFYRLAVRELFEAFDKILYLDSDLIIKEDVARLYFEDMGDCLVAACLDPDFIGEYNGGIPAVRQYCDKVLCLNDPFRYFQAGVMVFNIREMCKSFVPWELVHFAQKREYMYVDQDVLNFKCQGRVHYLNMAWNVMTDCAGIRVEQFIRRAPLPIYQQYKRARQSPKIIHYAGFSKPWTNPHEDMAEDFWRFARSSLFYEIIIKRMVQIPAKDKRSSIKKFLKPIMLNIISVFFPKGTARRYKLNKFYFKLRGWPC